MERPPWAHMVVDLGEQLVESLCLWLTMHTRCALQHHTNPLCLNLASYPAPPADLDSQDLEQFQHHSSFFLSFLMELCVVPNM